MKIPLPLSAAVPVFPRTTRFNRLQQSWKAALLALLSCSGMVFAAQPLVTVDFQALEQNNGSFHNQANYYAEDGYQVKAGSVFQNPLLPPVLVTIGTGASQYCGSTAIHTNISWGTISVSPIASGTFTPVSVKLGLLVPSWAGNGYPTAHFYGRKMDGSFVQQSFSLNGQALGTQQTFIFHPSFTDILELRCEEVQPFFQLDDLVLAEGSIHTNYDVLFAQGAPVPGAGTTEPRIQAGAVWSGFGPPAINAAGDVAFIGRWKAPAVTGASPVPAQAGVGIFLNNVLVAKVGEAANASGDLLWKSFKDPVIAADGSLAWLGAVKGVAVTSATDTVAAYWTDLLPVIVAREGTAAPAHPGNPSITQTWKAFSTIARVNGATALTGIATRSEGLPANTPILVAGLDSGDLRVLIERELSIGGDEVVSFSALKAGAGSPGQGRNGLMVVGDGVQVAANIKSGQSGSQVAFFDVATGTSSMQFSFDRPGLVALLPSNDFVMRAAATPTSMAIFVNSFPFVTAGSADGAPEGTTWKSFKDPVPSGTDSTLAFAAQLNGATSANDDGIWWTPYFSPLRLVAREGDHPPGAPADAKWKTFSSLALPGGTSGPIFTATLQKGPGITPGPGGITSVDDLGLYGLDSFGVVVELLRENQPLLGKTVKTFNVIKAVAGTAGSSRSFNGAGEIVVLVTFTDKTTAIVRISVPQVLPPVEE
jgi:hypothetical protein